MKELRKELLYSFTKAAKIMSKRLVGASQNLIRVEKDTLDLSRVQPKSELSRLQLDYNKAAQKHYERVAGQIIELQTSPVILSIIDKEFNLSEVSAEHRLKNISPAVISKMECMLEEFLNVSGDE